MFESFNYAFTRILYGLWYRRTDWYFIIFIIGPLSFFISFFLGSAVQGAFDVQDFTSFLVLGTLGMSIMNSGFEKAYQRLNGLYHGGGFAAIYTTPLKLWQFIIGDVLCFWLIRTLQILVTFGLIAIMGLPIQLSFWTIYGTLFIAYLSMLGIGLIFAALTLLVGDISSIFQVARVLFRLLSGHMYPISVLPASLQFLAKALPMHYALEAIRSAGLQGASLTDLAPELGILALFGAGLFIMGYTLLTQAERLAKMEGLF